MAKAAKDQAPRRQPQQEVEAATIAYYAGITPEERAEDDALSAASSRAAKKLDIDGPAKTRRTRGR